MKVVCSNCSVNRLELEYAQGEKKRVCNNCFWLLMRQSQRHLSALRRMPTSLSTDSTSEDNQTRVDHVNKRIPVPLPRVSFLNVSFFYFTFNSVGAILFCTSSNATIYIFHHSYSTVYISQLIVL